jgi:hypothetical protein
MDGVVRRLIAKIAGAAIALIVFAVGMKFGCGRHDDPAGDARRDLLVAGCGEAGFDQTSPRFHSCLEGQKQSARTARTKTIVKCRDIDPKAPNAPTNCAAVVACAKSVGIGLK